MKTRVFGMAAAALLLAGCATERGGIRDDSFDVSPNDYPGAAGPATRPGTIRDSNNPSGVGPGGFITPGRTLGTMPARPLGGTQ